MSYFNFTVTSRVHPGRFPDAIEQARDAGQILGRLGASEPFVGRVAVGGEMATLMAFAVEWPSAEAFGETMDAMASDQEAIALQERSQAPDAPVSLLSITGSTGIPLTDDPPHVRDSAVVYAETYQVRSGRLEEAITGLDKAVSTVLRVGATSMQVQVADIGGSTSGHLVLAVGFDSMASVGRARDAMVGDAEIAAQIEHLQGAKGSIDLRSAALVTRIAL